MSEPDARLRVAKLLLSQDDDEATGSALLRIVMEFSGADRGYVVGKDGDQFRPVFTDGFDAQAEHASARYSRSLVRLALAKNEPIHSMNPAEDPSFSEVESVTSIGGRAVLVVPLSSGDVRFGALYLEHPRTGGFTAEAMTLVADIAELAGLCLHSALVRSFHERRASSLEDGLLAKSDFQGILTRDPGMMRLLRTLVQVSAAKASVMICGETGTGKELLARALHMNSERRRGPFVTLHCAALPGTMLESELFGHVRGAFTGAERDRAGRIASAHGGTLFLDEVAEIPADTQAKLLRAVQFGELQRLGSDKIERVDVRVVSATHRDVAQRVGAGSFRQDLYYRLRVIELTVPPLRSRPADVLLLAEKFRGRFAKRELSFSRTVQRCLQAYEWPGNVRELENAIERACLLALGPTIEPEDLPPEIGTASRSLRPPPAPDRFTEFSKDELEAATAATVGAVEREFVEGLLAKHSGNVSQAAASSGIHRSQLQKLMGRTRPPR